MASRRELILAALHTTLQGVAGLTVYRSRQQALATTDSTVAILEPQSETVTPLDIHAGWQRSLDVAVSLLARGAIPDQVADTAVAAIESALAANPTAGGNAWIVAQTGISWNMADADQLGIAEIVLQYRVDYN